MSIFKMPKGIVNRVEQLFRNFLWGCKEESRKVHLVRWSKVTKPKRGGLEIVRLGIRNHALLCKWSWRFEREECFIEEVLLAMYGVENENKWNLSEEVERK